MKKSYLIKYEVSEEVNVYKIIKEKDKSSLPTEKHQWIYRFPNNYGASILNEPNTYGLNKDKDGTFEVAILKFKGDDWDFYGQNHIRRMLDFEGVAKLLSKIKRKRK
jgi:hypothetical protein